MQENLKGFGHGDFTFLIGFIKSQHFESRSQFDDLCSKMWQSSRPEDNYVKSIENQAVISLEQIFQHFKVDLKCDLQFYSMHPEELTRDLGRPSNDLQGSENELYTKVVTKLFSLEDTEQVLTFKEFRPLYHDGNDTYASAERGPNYFIFYHVTS